MVGACDVNWRETDDTESPITHAEVFTQSFIAPKTVRETLAAVAHLSEDEPDPDDENWR